MIDEHTDRAAKAFHDVQHAADSVYRQSAGQAGLAMLGAAAAGARAMDDAVVTLAIELLARGEKTTDVARAAGVNRTTINRWRNARNLDT